ncbi:MAG: sodium:proton antiporter [Magnetococcales bacterium]|nr:cation:proton antiporter [Magnetococcales bacterium]NGZ27764.1 sodium:proton antiporter [Magnetococcales bacterium]
MDAGTTVVVAKQTLITFGTLLGIGTLGGFLASKIRIPDVAIFLLVGMAIGPEGFALVEIRADSALNQLILIFGSCYILFDGGASLRFKVLKEVWLTIVIISTVGVLITCFATGLVAYFALHTPMIVALLLGATLASTDPAVLVPIFKQVRVKDRVAQTVMSESAFNDAMGAIVTFAILNIALGLGTFDVHETLFKFIKEAGLGIVAGAILGYLAALLIAHEKWCFLTEYAPVVTLMSVISAYMVTDGMEASGFMAVFVFGLVLGNKNIFGFRMEPNEKKRMEEFIMTTSFIMRMFIFLLLGSQVSFALMNKYLLPGLLIVSALIFVARPLAVYLCTLPDRKAKWERNELLFMCWTRETGVIPGALAGMLVGMKAPGAEMIASVTFLAILITIVLQATTTRWLAGRLGLLVEEQPRPHMEHGKRSLPPPVPIQVAETQGY